ncbi:MAG: hypothetical protein NWF09_07500 [Candidatus Bathyarchaeota archaeon]|nr:hypothetical protein [Candidatus Bathyarchaeota archaeon]
MRTRCIKCGKLLRVEESYPDNEKTDEDSKPLCLKCAPLPKDLMTQNGSVEKANKITEQIIHDVAMKINIIADLITDTPNKIADPSIINLLGKCLQSGIIIIRSHIDKNQLNNIEEFLDDFNTRYKCIINLFEKRRRGIC